MKSYWIFGIGAALVIGGAAAIAQQNAAPLAPNAPAAEASPAALEPITSAASPSDVATLQEAAPAATPRAGYFANNAVLGASAPQATSGVAAAPFAGPRALNATGQAAATGTSMARSANAPVQGQAGFGGLQRGELGVMPSAGGNSFGRGGGFGGGGGYGGTSFGGWGAPNMMLSQEAKAYQEAEQKARTLAMNLRQSPPGEAANEKLKTELKAAVTQAFEARQAMQKAEIKRLKDKLAEIESVVSRREEAKAHLIDEKVYEMTQEEGGLLGGAPSLFGASAGVGFGGMLPPVEAGPTMVESAPTTDAAPIEATRPTPIEEVQPAPKR